MSSAIQHPSLRVGLPADAGGLVEFANAALPGLLLPNGLFCFDRTYDAPSLRGESVRYSTMVLLGLLRRAQHNAPTSIDVDMLHARVHDRLPELGIGDLGLLLWADARAGDAVAIAATLGELSRKSASPAALAELEGMEIAWFAIGATIAYGAGHASWPIVDRALTELRRRRSATSPLFRHVGTRSLRGRLPNFATQIYGLLAISEALRHDLARSERPHAERLAELLIDSRDDNFGWPWLYDAERGTVVERYEVYSVHQDAMAPMALLALAEVTDEVGYADAAVEGLRWGFGNNELGVRFYDHSRLFAHRSLRRAGSAHRAGLLGNTALSLLGVSARCDPGCVELNTTCRPYHLGWILEAWSGRERPASGGDLV